MRIIIMLKIFKNIFSKSNENCIYLLCKINIIVNKQDGLNVLPSKIKHQQV